MVIDANGANIIEVVSASISMPDPLIAQFAAAATTDAKIVVIAKKLGLA